MANRRQYDLQSFREAIEAHAPDKQAIADAMDCSRSTVYAYLRKYPELQAAYDGVTDEGVQSRPQFSKEKFEKAISGSKGIKSAIAVRVGCTRQTVDNALERWPDLAKMLESERGDLVDYAETKLLALLAKEDVRATLFTLETLGKSRGWTKRTEVTGPDGERLFTREDMELAAELGIDMSEAVEQFRAMMLAKARAEGKA